MSGARLRTREEISGKRPAKVGARFAAVAVTPAIAWERRHTGARLGAIRIPQIGYTKPRDTGKWFATIIVAAAV